MKQRISPPRFLNSSLEQLFYGRESVLRRFQAIEKELRSVEDKIALTSCPYSLGQLVNHRKGNSVSRAIISRIQFIPSEPFYRIYLKQVQWKSKRSSLLASFSYSLNSLPKLYFGSEFLLNWTDESISAPISSQSSANPQMLEWLIDNNVIRVSSDKFSVIRDVVDSVERGKSFTALGFRDDLKAMMGFLDKPFDTKKRKLFPRRK